ncbi:MAG: outer membrane beta-barrel protein [Acidobacteria bacterium]|nr:outer membrane beta-barrel protein [Acidobacteriota bacterium]
MRAWLLGAAVVAAASSGAARAGEWQVTPLAGFRGGGSVEEIGTGDSVSLDEGLVLGLTLGRSVGPEQRIEVVFSRQDSGVSGRSANIDHIHLAGVYEPDNGRSVRGYAVASVGATRFALTGGGADSDVRFSASAGGGARLVLGAHVSARLEVRGWGILANADAKVFCSGGCEFAFAGDGVFQIETTAGLSISF